MNGAHDVGIVVELLADVLALPGDRPRREYQAEEATDGDERGAEGGRAAVMPHGTTGRPGHREARHIRFVIGPVPRAEGAGQRQLTERRDEKHVPNARDDIKCLNARQRNVLLVKNMPYEGEQPRNTQKYENSECFQEERTWKKSKRLWWWPLERFRIAKEIDTITANSMAAILSMAGIMGKSRVDHIDETALWTHKLKSSHFRFSLSQ